MPFVVTSSELKNLALRAMLRRKQQHLMAVMTAVLKTCLLYLMDDIVTMWISLFFVITAYVYLINLPFFCSFFRLSLSVCVFIFQGSGEQSQELYTFHEAVSQLQDAEDKLVDDHRKNIEVSNPSTVQASHKLFAKVKSKWIRSSLFLETKISIQVT